VLTSWVTGEEPVNCHIDYENVWPNQLLASVVGVTNCFSKWNRSR
jgi:hypothetical protein